MANPQLICDGNTGRAVQFPLQGHDDSVSSFPAHGTAYISDYTKAFVAQVPTPAGQVAIFEVKAKITKAVGDPTDTVTATFNMIDSASGVALPPFVVSVDLVAPPPAAQKDTHVVQTAPASIVTGDTIADPGSATITVVM